MSTDPEPTPGEIPVKPTPSVYADGDTIAGVIAALVASQEALAATFDPLRFEQIARVQWMIDALADGSADMAFYAAGHADGLNARVGPDVGRVQVSCVDPDTYATIWCKGSDATVAMGLADDPAAAEEWLEEKLRQARTGELDLGPFRQALDEIETRMRRSGGGVQEAFKVAAGLVQAAFEQYGGDGE